MQNKITASEGHILTNGETYGVEIYLGEGVDADSFHEITREEYESILAEQAEAMLPPV